MITVIVDASPLITACKFKVKKKLVIDSLLLGCRIMIASSVEEEVAISGAQYPDGAVAGERIARGDICVVPVTERKWERYLDGYALGDGERDSIELCGQTEGAEALIVDDYLAFVTATRLGLKAWMLPDLVVQLAVRGSLPLGLAKDILEGIRSRYHAGVIAHSLECLREARGDAEGRSPGEEEDPGGPGTPQGRRSG